MKLGPIFNLNPDSNWDCMTFLRLLSQGATVLGLLWPIITRQVGATTLAHHETREPSRSDSKYGYHYSSSSRANRDPSLPDLFRKLP